MEALSILGETAGTLVLVGAIGGIFYAFYRILKGAFSAIKDNDD
jgi:hypothetical protein